MGDGTLKMFGLVSIVAFAWLLQYGLTWLQIRHYRAAMRKLVQEYRNTEGYYLFSGIARKALGSGAIVLVIVDNERIIRYGQVLTGFTVFARFKPHTEYIGHRIEEVLKESEATLRQKRHVSSKRQSLARAFKMASENALRSLDSREVSRLQNAEGELQAIQ